VSAEPELLPLELTDEISAAVNGAYEAGMPVMVAYLDGDGYPRMSLRGTTQVFGPHQLAVWARVPDGGLSTAISERPRVSLFFRNPSTRQTYIFYGRARVAGDAETDTVVYERSPAREREMDPDRGGHAVIIDLERVDGISPERRFRMER
jgi:hypothetical protein